MYPAMVSVTMADPIERLVIALFPRLPLSTEAIVINKTELGYRREYFWRDSESLLLSVFAVKRLPALLKKYQGYI